MPMRCITVKQRRSTTVADTAKRCAMPPSLYRSEYQKIGNARLDLLITLPTTLDNIDSNK